MHPKIRHKPSHMILPSNRPRCPICNHPSFSRDGVHPQCQAVQREAIRSRPCGPQGRDADRDRVTRDARSFSQRWDRIGGRFCCQISAMSMQQNELAATKVPSWDRTRRKRKPAIPDFELPTKTELKRSKHPATSDGTIGLDMSSGR